MDKRFFVGLPIPAAAGTLSALIWTFSESPADEVKAAFLPVTVLLSFLMVSTFRYRSFKDIDLRSRRSALLVPLVGLVLAAILWRPQWAFGALLVVYSLSAPVTRLLTLRPSFLSRKASGPGEKTPIPPSG